MKKVGSFISLSFLVLFLLVGCEKSSSDWVEYSMNDDGGIWLYNKKNITKSEGKDIVKVWTKWIFTDEEKEKTLKIVKNSGWSTEGWDKLSHRITSNKIDCKNKKVQLLSITDYDTEGKVLNNGNNEELEWVYIVPGSMGHILWEKVCK